VALQIADLVAQGQIEVGSRLPSLAELCTQLGVSRSAVREGIKLLDAWGIVTVRHGVGTFVSGVTDDTLTMPLRVSAERSAYAIRNLHQLREALEPNIAELAASNAGPVHLREMKDALDRMESLLSNASEGTDDDQFVEIDLAFHSALAKATGNDLFLIVIRPVIHLLQEARRLSVETPGATHRAQVYHRMILERVRAGQPGGAKEAMRAHLAQTWQEIAEQIE
jgi:GntR family transcriptional repressor for pyruvate dehydrogenase complex